MRPGADKRTQQCLRCKRSDQLESVMVEANRVRPARSRGWYCMHCAVYLNPAKFQRPFVKDRGTFDE